MNLPLTILIIDQNNDNVDKLIDSISGRTVFDHATYIGMKYYATTLFFKEHVIQIQIIAIINLKFYNRLIKSYSKNSSGIILFYNQATDKGKYVQNIIDFLEETSPKIPIMLITEPTPKESDDNLQSLSQLKTIILNLQGVCHEIESKDDESINTHFLEFLVNLLNNCDLDLEVDELLIYKEYKREVSDDFIKMFFIEAEEYLKEKKFAEAHLIIDLIKALVKRANIHNFDNKLKRFEKQIEIKKRKLLVLNKKKIHKSVYEETLKKCNMHEELSTECAKRKKIKEMIETPEIFGFFMYEFPKLENDNYGLFEQYKKEVQQITELIDITNKNSIIEIKFPRETTGIDVKICSFCEISRSSDFGILLLSKLNPNAFLEAGMFLSLGKKVILLINEDLNEEVPFDLTPFFHVHYKTMKELQESWQRKVIPFLKNMMSDYFEVIS